MKRILNGITPEKLAEIASMLQQRTGIALQENEGTQEIHGFRVHFCYDPAQQTLELELLKKPWFVPESLIESKIDQFLTGPGAAFLGEGR